MATPIGKGHRSLNLTLRKELQLYSYLYSTVHFDSEKNVFHLSSGAFMLQVITRVASTRVAEYAFKYADENKRNKVTAVHKANIMKMADGLFIKCCREGEAQQMSVLVNNTVLATVFHRMQY